MMATSVRSRPDVELAEQIDALGKADRVYFALHWGLRAIAASLAIDALLLLGMRIYLLQAPLWSLAVPPTVFALFAALATFVHRSPPLALAKKADRMMGLRERVTTAVELGQRGDNQPFADLQLADTLSHLRSHRPAQAFPIRIGRFELSILFMSAAALVLPLLLPVAQPLPSANRTVQEAIKQEAERVNTLAEAVESDTGEQDTAFNEAVAKALRDAGKALEQEPSSAEGAMAALSEAEQKLAGQQNLRAEDMRQALARVAQALKGEPTTRELGSQLAEGDTQSAANALRGLADRAGAMSEAQRTATSQALRAAASGAARSDPKLGESLRQASDALASGEPQTQGALDRAASDLQQAAKESASQAMVEKALAQLERSRAEIGSAAQASISERGAQESAEKASNAGQQAGTNNPTSRGDDGGSQGLGERAGEPGGSGAGKGSLERSTNSFDPNGINSHQEFVPSTQFDRPSVSESERIGLPDRGESGVDYREVYAEYRDRAMVATQDRYIPLDLKELVKGYFSALDPSR